jgi:hypothetical protein
VSIVNGAQTVGTIGKYAEAGKENHKNLCAHVRIIALHDGDSKFGEGITKTNNRQNRIENRDFVALDPEQGRIRTELAIDKIDYHVLREESASRTETAFDLVEGTTALACASGNIGTVVQLKREIGKLWEDIEKAPYKELFNGSVTGMYVWRCVRAQRAIDQGLESIIKDLGTNSGRDYGVAVHGNRIVAALVFEHLKIREYRDPQNDFEALFKSTEIIDRTRMFYDRLRNAAAKYYPNAMIPTLFKNLSKCKDLAAKCGLEDIPTVSPIIALIEELAKEDSSSKA